MAGVMPLTSPSLVAQPVMAFGQAAVPRLSPALKPKLSQPPQPKSPVSNQGRYTVTQDGQYKQLQTVGGGIGAGQAGVGIFFQQEGGRSIYVASMVPGGAAALDGRINENDELIRVNNYPIGPNSGLEDVREVFFCLCIQLLENSQNSWTHAYMHISLNECKALVRGANTKVNAQHILGECGTHVVLSFRRRGVVGEEDYYFDLKLGREKAPPLGAPDGGSTLGVQRAPTRSVHRAGPPSQSAGYEKEIANLRDQVDTLRSMKGLQGLQDDPRVAPLENELNERINDLQRVEQMYERARDRLEVSQRNCHEVPPTSLSSRSLAARRTWKLFVVVDWCTFMMCWLRLMWQVNAHLAQLQEENARLIEQDKERGGRFEDLHRESGMPTPGVCPLL